MFKQNRLYSILIGIAIAILMLFIFPYLNDTGHLGVGITLLVVLIGAWFYGCHEKPLVRLPKPPARRRPL